MRSLTLVSGAAWPLSPRARTWLAREPQFVPIDVVAPGSEETRRRFPGLPAGAGETDLAAIADDGGLWRGASAWLMALWALEGHRRAALELARTGRAGEARRVVEGLARGLWSIPARPPGTAPVASTSRAPPAA